VSYITIEVWDATGNRKNEVELPDDVPVNRIIVVLIDRLGYPRYDSTGGQLLSYKLHHQATRRQLLDDQTLGEAGVEGAAVLRLQPEITAGRSYVETENTSPDRS
jgi:hypothetical protein